MKKRKGVRALLDVLGRLERDPIAEMLQSPFKRFKSPIGLHGQCQVIGDTVEILSIQATNPGTGAGLGIRINQRDNSMESVCKNCGRRNNTHKRSEQHCGCGHPINSSYIKIGEIPEGVILDLERQHEGMYCRWNAVVTSPYDKCGGKQVYAAKDRTLFILGYYPYDYDEAFKLFKNLVDAETTGTDNINYLPFSLKILNRRDIPEELVKRVKDLADTQRKLGARISRANLSPRVNELYRDLSEPLKTEDWASDIYENSKLAEGDRVEFLAELGEAIGEIKIGEDCE